MICLSWLRGRCLLGMFMLVVAWPALASFNDNGDGTVTDTVNGLMWDRCVWGLGGTICTGTTSFRTWTQALDVAIIANIGNYRGYNDWRLPNRNELESLVEPTRANPAIDPVAFPNTPAGVGSFLWSSTSLAFLSADAAWVVHFDDGSTITSDKSNAGHVRLVRGGQPFDFFDAQLSALSIIVPDAFSFTAQTGAALNTLATSSSITVAGINSATAISVVGGTYSINGGAYTAGAGTVSNGQTVTVRQTASASYSSTTTATLIIGGVSGAFNVTTGAAPTATSYSAPSATGTGNITAGFTGGGAGCAFAASQFSTAPPPSGVTLTHGVFSFNTTNCGAGSTLNFTLTYPQALPAGTRYYKYGPEFGGSQTPHWYVLPGAVVSGKQITFSITDNGVGDSNPAAGFITDPGGPGVQAGAGVGVTGVPTLSEWGVLILTTLMAGLGLCVLPGRKMRTIDESVTP